MALDRSAMAVSVFSSLACVVVVSGFLWEVSSFSVLCILERDCDASLCRESCFSVAACFAVVRPTGSRRWPPSRSNELLPSIPSLVTAKKKFFGYMCLSIRCILRFCGVLHFRSQPSTKQEYYNNILLVIKVRKGFSRPRMQDYLRYVHPSPAKRQQMSHGIPQYEG